MGILLKSFYESSITLILKPERTLQENTDIYLWQTHLQNSQKKLANIIQYIVQIELYTMTKWDQASKAVSIFKNQCNPAHQQYRLKKKSPHDHT